MQMAVHPNATLHSGIFVLKFKGLETDHERRNEIPCVGREDRYGYHFVNTVSGSDIPDLPFVGQLCERKLSFCCWVQFSYIRGIRRLDDCAVVVEEAIKPGV